jgi:uridine kinase
MKVALLLCGFLRTFKHNYNNLNKNLLNNYDCDIFLHISRNESSNDKYINNSLSIIDQINSVIQLYDPISFICEKESNFKNKNKCEDNTFKFFHKIYQVNNLRLNYEYLNDFKYDIVIIMRPDIYFKDNYDIIKNNHKLINDNFIIFSNSGLNRTICDKDKSLDDKLCIGNSNSINNFVNLYKKIKEYIKNGFIIISENILYYYINNNNYPYFIDENIKYKVILSISNSIAISGDSGTGKTTISKLINNIFNETLHLECDRYHKWERGDPKWKEITHLNPDANFLLKMRKDFFDLKIGDDIYQVDYDHSNGKFTQKNEIKAKKNIILCGLHTLHDKKIVNNMNLNIYLDPDINLKKYWKIIRDMKKRGYTVDEVLKKIEQREQDYKKYIDPQKHNADMIIKFYNTEKINYLDMIKNKEIKNYGLKLLFKKECISEFSNLLNKYKINYNQGVESNNKNFYYYINFKNPVEKKYLIEFINENKIIIKNFEEGYFLIIQIFIILYLEIKNMK